MKIKDNETLLFIGDSITDCGRTRPVGEGNGLGEGYVSIVDHLLTSNASELKIKILNTGIGGNRVTNLKSRWQRDALDIKPDWLSVMIGINDVWKQFGDSPKEDYVTIDKYEQVYRDILSEIRGDLKGLVLMTPYMIETDANNPMRALMDEYSLVVKKLANEFDAVFIQLQDAFDLKLAHCSIESLCNDRLDKIHPNSVGHTVIAESFLEGIEFNWAR